MTNHRPKENRHRIDVRRRKTSNLTSVNSLVNHGLRYTMTARGGAAVDWKPPIFSKKGDGKHE